MIAVPNEVEAKEEERGEEEEEAGEKGGREEEGKGEEKEEEPLVKTMTAHCPAMTLRARRSAVRLSDTPLFSWVERGGEGEGREGKGK